MSRAAQEAEELQAREAFTAKEARELAKARELVEKARVLLPASREALLALTGPRRTHEERDRLVLLLIETLTQDGHLTK